MLTQGPVDEFFHALEELVKDVESQLNDEISYWAIREVDNREIINDLNSLIVSAEYDVASTR